MKIAFTSSGKDLDANLDERFGRCPYFLIVNPDTEDYEVVENKNQSASGAGVQVAQILVDSGVQVVVTGNVGPNAIKVLQVAGVEIYAAGTGTVRRALINFKQNRLEVISEATVRSHSGVNGN
jgi:predicted Fe-Mo cluster-binding NifX family protein